MSILAVDRRAWHSLFAAQIGWMLDAMDFLLFTFAVVPIALEFHLSKAAMGALPSVALIAGGIGGIVFGRVADRIGRVRALTFSIALYSLATAGLATAGAPWQLAVSSPRIRVGRRALYPRPPSRPCRGRPSAGASSSSAAPSPPSPLSSSAATSRS